MDNLEATLGELAKAKRIMRQSSVTVSWKDENGRKRQGTPQQYAEWVERRTRETVGQ